MKLILLRHGESQWNLENRFTGWNDVELTPNGIAEANFAGKQLLNQEISISSIHTSLLARAQYTSEIVAEILQFKKRKIVGDWRLNERHYGALEGLNKSETASKYGEKQVHIWRRSYDIPPPKLTVEDKRHPRFNKKFKNIPNKSLPTGESLKMVIERLEPFWIEYIDQIKRNPLNHLIVAHSNSLRAIVKTLDRLSEKEIISINIPTGVPLVYEIDKNLSVIGKYYLINEDELRLKQDEIANQGKVK
jgi:2,3-bisphosphoglycerate-dependent phosphoglycerate mutase